MGYLRKLPFADFSLWKKENKPPIRGFLNLDIQTYSTSDPTGYKWGTATRRPRSCHFGMSPNLETLFPDSLKLKHAGNLQIPVNALVTDSRRVIPGSVFFAIPGLRTNGTFYVEEAIDRGAVAVVLESDQIYPQVTTIQVEDIRKVVAQVSRNFYEKPDERLELIGITGTNGKTTVSYIVQSLLKGVSNRLTGLIGTIQYDLGHRTLPSFKTTPEAIDSFSLLKQMLEAGCTRSVIEVSSHGIDQKRIFGMGLKIAVFLNLTQDHLDYHGDLETYFKVKQSLFTGEICGLPEYAVVNLDDSYSKRLVSEMDSTVKLRTFSMENNRADFYLSNYQCDHAGSRFTLNWSGGKLKGSTKLPGLYNLSNILAALAVCDCLGIAIETVLPILEIFPGVPGRMERIEEAEGYDVFVDYAHTDDALDKALSMLRGITRERLLVTFGCGGNRDRDKRKSMMEVAQRHADFVCATSDNPRGESIEAIFEDMKAGVQDSDSIEFNPDRKLAIGRVLGLAQPGDTVLIAGKGHETMQEFKDRIVPFDDRVVTWEVLKIKQLEKLRKK